MGSVLVQTSIPLVENEGSEKSYAPFVAGTMQTCCLKPSLSGRYARFRIKALPIFGKSYQTRGRGWSIAFALDTGEAPGNGGQEGVDRDNTGLGSTRLGRIVQAGGKQLLEKLNSARKNFPMKIFLLLLGFYTANALATILGQTGDWDVLVAGVVVAAIEGIGMLMYKKTDVSSKWEIAVIGGDGELLESWSLLRSFCGCLQTGELRNLHSSIAPTGPTF